MITNPSLLSANELFLAYETRRLLDGVTLAVAPGEKVGLVGRNGWGKTSLLRILTGEIEADAGEISLRRGLRVGYLPQEFELDGRRRCRRTSSRARPICWSGCAAMKWRRQRGRLPELHHQIDAADGWNLDARIEPMSTALRAAAARCSRGTAFRWREAPRRALPRSGRAAGSAAARRTDEPSRCRIDPLARGFSAQLSRRGDLRDARPLFPRCHRHAHHRARRRALLFRIRATTRPTSNRRPCASRSPSRPNAVASGFCARNSNGSGLGVGASGRSRGTGSTPFTQIAGLEAPPEEREMDLLFPPPPDMGNIGVELEDAGARVGEGSDERWLFRDLESLPASRASAPASSGATAWARPPSCACASANAQADEGTVTHREEGRVQLHRPDAHATRRRAHGLEEIADADETVMFGTQRLSARAYLRRFLFTDDRVRERVDLLSGGERARLMLAKVLKRGGNVIVLDEPTNDLDLPSLRMLEEALVDFDGSRAGGQP